MTLTDGISDIDTFHGQPSAGEPETYNKQKVLNRQQNNQIVTYNAFTIPSDKVCTIAIRSIVLKKYGLDRYQVTPLHSYCCQFEAPHQNGETVQETE